MLIFGADFFAYQMGAEIWTVCHRLNAAY